jgi:hypothetical protein
MLGGVAVDGWEAEVELARGLAASVDESPSAELWREYRMALKQLREAMSNDDAPSDSVTSLLDRLGGASVRDVADAGS